MNCCYSSNTSTVLSSSYHLSGCGFMLVCPLSSSFTAPLQLAEDLCLNTNITTVLKSSSLLSPEISTQSISRT
eukprot:m.199396 g.199396  ORF g.199396 m.199396 type:complete len:73 (+) comp39570_c0_seq28:508-726(+)